MGEKDSCEKLLEDYADVFADIINVLVFHGERLLKEEHIVPGPTASIYKDETRGLRPQIRDVMKFDKKEQSVFSVIGLENQSTADPDMVFRVIEVAYLPKEVREQFTSDFRIVVDYFSSVREGREEEFIRDTRTFRHVEEMLEFFRIFSGDKRYQEIERPILEMAEKGESISMCTLMDTAINKGWREGEIKGKIEGEIEGEIKGELKGKVKGKMEAYYGLVGEGILTTEQAAEKIGLSTSGFLAKIEELGLES